jgi:uncharacterized protein YndB with AHSA1/START domain
MSTTQATSAERAPGEDTVLRIARVFSAPQSRVFEAFVDPEQLRAWWGPKGYTTVSAKIDLRPGGAYQLEMRSPEGNTHDLCGTYREVDRPRKLVLTWAWQQGALAGVETLVTLEFRGQGDKMEVSLTHELPTDRAYEMHAMGWNGSFDCLVDFFVGN